MPKKTPNTLQKLARRAARNLINNNREETTHKTETNKPKTTKNTIRKSKAQHNTSTRSRNISKSVRVSVLNRDRYKCVFCGRSSKKVELEVDHIVPFSKGGSNDISNLQTLCFDCNRGKGSRYLK